MVQDNGPSRPITSLRSYPSLTVGLAPLVSIRCRWTDICLVGVRAEWARVRGRCSRAAFSIIDCERSPGVPAFDRDASHILLDSHNDSEHPQQGG